MGERHDAAIEILPPKVPGLLHPLLGAADGAMFADQRWKYGFGTDVAARDATLRAVLEELRAALAGRDYL